MRNWATVLSESRNKRTSIGRGWISDRAYHLKESEVGGEDVIEVDLGRLPGVVEVRVGETVVLVVDEVDVDQLAGHVDARLEPAAEQVDAHDAEDEPEHEADDEHVEDGRNRLDQSVHHHLPCTAVPVDVLLHTPFFKNSAHAL